jgi:hypothetical protein
MRLALSVLPALCVMHALGCVPSNVVAADERAVAMPSDKLAWDAALPAGLTGLYESVSIRGDAAQSLLKVYYWFAASGEFTGAALVLVDGVRQFQTLAGRYRIDAGSILLGDDSAPAALLAAKDHLRLTSADGEVTLRRVGD